jgi:hypothetical protein
MAVIVIFWGAVAWLFVHPPGPEDIPWLIAGVSIWIIIHESKKK